MLCDFVTGEDHFFPAVASAEVIHVVPSFVAVPASTGIFFPYHEHPRPVRLEIGIHVFTQAEKEKRSPHFLSGKERPPVSVWCTRQDSNLHGFPADPKSLCTSCNYVLEFEENAHFIEKSQVRDRIASLLREAL